MRNPPYPTVLKPYGQALVKLAQERSEILCLTGDLTRQCEIDLFQEALPERFIHAGMAEANMVGMAGGLARRGYLPFVHTFGVFATRRPLDQIINAVAYPSLPVRLVGFMPGISSPGGPSHQAIDDVALMRAVPNMTVVDVADAVEIERALPAITHVPGPVYLRLKRGEIPVIFDDDHEFSLHSAQVIEDGDDIALIASGMMLSAALAAAAELRDAGIGTKVLNVPVVKPLDEETVLEAASGVRAVVTAENHTVIGGLGSAVAETLAGAGLGRPLRRLGLQDTFAEGAKSAPSLFRRYGLGTQDLIDTAWTLLGAPGTAPRAAPAPSTPGEYAPV
ncbi:transketolase [Actinobacteria bacterium YIM 96077]|uniref:Transketolase n=1 Tax=Phytoactinopolyspora halophila TaxID=1981511 RepID=A0A329QYY2_9ACTN|nr:transketolase C-terminal domain-containing protein [Phytoactinopolyspora halophila]AYY13338.1 transketolase [Actinobacteria bacterium YIM 96077]RAW17427.1 transketolase [Phytoactinopolyspora halophila]